MRWALAADGRLEQLESRLAELEAQNRMLEKQRSEIEKALADEKRGKRRTTLCADSFVFKLIDTLSEAARSCFKEPVGDGMAPETSDLAWADYLADARPIAERVAADLNL